MNSQGSANCPSSDWTIREAVQYTPTRWTLNTVTQALMICKLFQKVLTANEPYGGVVSCFEADLGI